MIIKCKECEFRYVSRKDSIDDLVTEKIEHEFITKHKVVFLLTLGARVIEKENPTNVYTCYCITCWNNSHKRTSYSTISRLDGQRYIDVHNQTMSRKEKHLYEYHSFSWNETEFESYSKNLIRNSPVIQKMMQDNIRPEQVNLTEKSMETGDQELAFYLNSEGSSRAETIIAYRIKEHQCPLCMSAMIEGEDRFNEEILDKRFELLLSHVRRFHEGTENRYTSITINILQMCMLYQRNLYSIKGTTKHDRISKTGKKSQALRTLNKTGIPMSLLSDMFDLDDSRVGKYAYKGMEILGKPQWVQNAEI